MNPTFVKDEIFGELGFTKALLRRLKADTPEKRTAWVRFIAIRADAALSAPMSPRLLNDSVFLVDRHYCSLFGYQKDEPNLYLIRKEQKLMVRWIEMQGSNLSLRPDCGKHPLDFICIDRKTSLTSCIVGPVVHIGTELDNPVQRRQRALTRHANESGADVDAIAAGRLGRIQRAVGGGDQFVGGPAIVRKSRNAE
jgi:hypothetical protein